MSPFERKLGAVKQHPSQQLSAPFQPKLKSTYKPLLSQSSPPKRNHPSCQSEISGQKRANLMPPPPVPFSQSTHRHGTSTNVYSSPAIVQQSPPNSHSQLVSRYGVPVSPYSQGADAQLPMPAAQRGPPITATPYYTTSQQPSSSQSLRQTIYQLSSSSHKSDKASHHSCAETSQYSTLDPSSSRHGSSSRQSRNLEDHQRNSSPPKAYRSPYDSGNRDSYASEHRGQASYNEEDHYFAEHAVKAVMPLAPHPHIPTALAAPAMEANTMNLHAVPIRLLNTRSQALCAERVPANAVRILTSRVVAIHAMIAEITPITTITTT